MARAIRLAAQALVILGLAPIAYALGLLAWQAFTWLHTGAWVALPARLLVDPAALQAPRLADIAPFIPSADWSWTSHPRKLVLLSNILGVLLDRAHAGLVAALAGWGVIALGRGLAARQAEIIAWQEERRADRRRRIAQYRI